MRAMYDGFFADFGLLRQLHSQLHSDLGKNFESKLFYELCLLAGVSNHIQQRSTRRAMARPNG